LGRTPFGLHVQGNFNKRKKRRIGGPQTRNKKLGKGGLAWKEGHRRSLVLGMPRAKGRERRRGEKEHNT